MQPSFQQRKIDANKSADAAVRSYNNCMQHLINICVQKNKTDEHISSIDILFRSIIAIESSTVIRETGPYVWRYRDILNSRDEKFFNVMEDKVRDDVKEYFKKPGSGDKFKQSDVQSILRKFHDDWEKLTTPEKEVIWSYSIGLVTAYAQYIAAERALIKISKEIADMTR
jgi:hypothetical protein